MNSSYRAWTDWVPWPGAHRLTSTLRRVPLRTWMWPLFQASFYGPRWSTRPGRPRSGPAPRRNRPGSRSRTPTGPRGRCAVRLGDRWNSGRSGRAAVRGRAGRTPPLPPGHRRLRWGRTRRREWDASPVQHVEVQWRVDAQDAVLERVRISAPSADEQVDRLRLRPGMQPRFAGPAAQEPGGHLTRHGPDERERVTVAHPRWRPDRPRPLRRSQCSLARRRHQRSRR